MRFVRLPRLLGDDRAQDLIEYALIAGFIALVAFIGARTIGVALHGLYVQTSAKVNSGANFTTQGSATTGDCSKSGDSITPDTNSQTPTQTADASSHACK
jgi:Flp pilus assembly pilin Flp